jgi:hypothetical protein
MQEMKNAYEIARIKTKNHHAYEESEKMTELRVALKVES